MKTAPNSVPYRHLLSLLALFSGTALLAQILLDLSLPLTLALAAGFVVLTGGWLWHRAAPVERAALVTFLTVGSVAGLLATLAYDVAKFVLSQWDASPYNPFEIIRVFGVLLAGPSAPEVIVSAAGTAFHFLNGMTFGVAFCFLFGRRGVIVGILWGLFLETFQLTLFPGWLDIRFYREFVQISALGHVVYGATLGLLCQHALRRAAPKAQV